MKQYLKYSNLLLALTLSSCSEAADFSNPEFLGKSGAKNVAPQVHAAYLQCYALKKSEKEVCSKELALKYINKKHSADARYVQAFQYEAEKLGFKSFLNDLKLPCERIDNGPEFIEDKHAYLVKCTPDHQYHMQFDYKDKKWIIPKETTGD